MNLKKQKITREIERYYCFPYLLSGSFTEIKQKLTEFEENSGEWSRLWFEDESYDYYESHETRFVLYGERLETDEEFNKRLERTKKYAVANKKRLEKKKLALQERKKKLEEEEKKLYDKLKEKYGSGNTNV
jgi:hypothetical protein